MYHTYLRLLFYKKIPQPKLKTESVPENIKKALKRTKVQSMENKKGVLFSIRAKIFLCFLVPILFLILVGVFSYKKAAAGMYDTFRDSNEQTINTNPFEQNVLPLPHVIFLKYILEYHKK